MLWLLMKQLQNTMDSLKSFCRKVINKQGVTDTNSSQVQTNRISPTMLEIAIFAAVGSEIFVGS